MPESTYSLEKGISSFPSSAREGTLNPEVAVPLLDSKDLKGGLKGDIYMLGPNIAYTHTID